MKKVLLVAMMAGVVVSVSGCVGSNAVTGGLMKFNLRAVDNRYARGGLNMLLAPVYALTMATDVIIFNAIGFWAGRNPINGNPHIFDSKVDTMLEINDDLDPSLHDAPLAPLTRSGTSEKAPLSVQMKAVNENTLDFHIVYTNGEKAVLRGKKNGDNVSFRMDGELVAVATMDELEEFLNPDA